MTNLPDTASCIVININVLKLLILQLLILANLPRLAICHTERLETRLSPKALDLWVFSILYFSLGFGTTRS